MVDISNKLQGYAGTIVVHSIAIVILILCSFSGSLPDTGNEGLLINFGNSEDGFGSIEPSVNYDNAVIVSLPTHIKAPKIDEKKILTQDFEDAPTIEAKKKVVKKEIKKTIPTTEKIKPTKEVEEAKKVETKTAEVVKQQTVNKKALFPGKNPEGGTTGEGITGKEGNQGSLEGSPESTNRIGGATGGNGSGEGDGKGVSFNLGGRNALSLPKPDYLKQKQGIVVVEVIVDRKGNVTKATPGVKGSTTLDADLLKAAEKAALTAKFDVNQNAREYQKGSITYIFKLQ
jgi:colicin import membrane protein